MKKLLLFALSSIISIAGFTQVPQNENTLLWRISGNGLQKPSYLFGTIHMICGDDIQLSDSLQKAIRQADDVYLELDMDNMFELLGAVNKMKMRDDTTLADLLTPEEYTKVKEFFSKKGGLLPFSMLETYKPMLAASTLMQSAIKCDNAIAMEQLVMKAAKGADKSIKGLESMSYQMSIFDSIPYKLQAKQLVDYVNDYGKEKGSKDFEKMVEAYRSQELTKLESMTTSEEAGMAQFTDILLYNRNKNWIEKLNGLMKEKSLVIAVGAGHLPGDKGVIKLLRAKGYKVEPVKNNMLKSNTKEI